MEILYLIPSIIGIYGIYAITKVGVKRIEELKAENAKLVKNQKEQPVLNKKEIYAINKQKGEEYEKHVGKTYENKGYTVEYRGIEKGRFDGGIDLIATKENETILIQCKYWRTKDALNHKAAKEFHSNCITFISKNNLENSNIHCKLAIPSKETLHTSAEKFFIQNHPKYRYEIIEYKIL